MHHINQMKLFNAIATAAIIGASFLAANPVSSTEYKVKLGGGSTYWGGPSFFSCSQNQYEPSQYLSQD